MKDVVFSLSEMPQRTRADILRAHRDRKIHEAFAGKKFDIIEEVHLPPGHVFQTQFGNKGRHGFIIQDRETGERHVVGLRMLKYIHDRYLGVSMPSKKKRRAVDSRGRDNS